jgi:hypothetical protein
MGAMALHGYSSMELKSRSFTSKEPHVAREPQVADPCPRGKPAKVSFSSHEKQDDVLDKYKMMDNVQKRNICAK